MLPPLDAALLHTPLRRVMPVTSQSLSISRSPIQGNKPSLVFSGKEKAQSPEHSSHFNFVTHFLSPSNLDKFRDWNQQVAKNWGMNCVCSHIIAVFSSLST